MLVAVGEVAPAQLDRVEVELIGQLVQRRFQREAARPFARRPRRVGLRCVHPHQAVRGGDVGAGVHHARRRGHRIGVLAVGRGLRHGVVQEGVEAPVARGADLQPLHRLLPPADQGEHLRAGELQPHRAAELSCRQAGQHQAGEPGAAFRAEAAAEIRRDHPHARDVEAKALRQSGAMGEHRLRRRVHGELAAVPIGQHHLRLDGQVVVRRRGVAPVERHGGRGQRRLGLAAPAVGGGEPGGARRESRLARLIQRRDGRQGRIAHLDRSGRGARCLRRFRQHQGDRLAGEMHHRFLQQGEKRRRRDSWRILVRQHVYAAGDRPGLR